MFITETLMLLLKVFSSPSNPDFSSQRELLPILLLLWRYWVSFHPSPYLLLPGVRTWHSLNTIPVVSMSQRCNIQNPFSLAICDQMQKTLYPFHHTLYLLFHYRHLWAGNHSLSSSLTVVLWQDCDEIAG